jgi:hypothetical protein
MEGGFSMPMWGITTYLYYLSTLWSGALAYDDFS